MKVLFVVATCFAQRPRIACIGDSNTEGSRASEDSKRWPAVLEVLLGDTYEVLNLGRSGRTLIDVPSFWYQDTDEWVEALLSNASVVLIALGTNDAKQLYWEELLDDPPADYLDAYEDMVDKVREALGPSVFIAALVPVPQVDGGGQWPDETIINEELPPLVLQAAQDNGLNVTVDLRPPLLDENGDAIEALYADNIHPNDAGLSLMAQTIAEAIAPLLGVEVVVPPTYSPTTSRPTTSVPSYSPTTYRPTVQPTTSEPTTAVPSSEPTVSLEPTPQPTRYKPTFAPTMTPTAYPTSVMPTPTPTVVPTVLATIASTPMPTPAPTTARPTTIPSPAPSYIPTYAPSVSLAPTTKTAAPSTPSPTSAPTTSSPSASPTTTSPTTSEPTTASPTTSSPTTAYPSSSPTTTSPTTAYPTTAVPVPVPTMYPTLAPTTAAPVSLFFLQVSTGVVFDNLAPADLASDDVSITVFKQAVADVLSMSEDNILDVEVDDRRRGRRRLDEDRASVSFDVADAGLGANAAEYREQRTQEIVDDLYVAAIDTSALIERLLNRSAGISIVFDSVSINQELTETALNDTDSELVDFQAAPTPEPSTALPTTFHPSSTSPTSATPSAAPTSSPPTNAPVAAPAVAPVVAPTLAPAVARAGVPTAAPIDETAAPMAVRSSSKKSSSGSVVIIVVIVVVVVVVALGALGAFFAYVRNKERAPTSFSQNKPYSTVDTTGVGEDDTDGGSGAVELPYTARRNNK